MAKHKIVKQKVIAFRLTVEQQAEFLQKLSDEPVLGAKSPGMVARKLVLDFVRNELTWKNKKRRLLAPELYKPFTSAAA